MWASTSALWTHIHYGNLYLVVVIVISSSSSTLCTAYSKSIGGSCVDCTNLNARIASDTWSTGTASRRCANVYVLSGDVCV